MIRKNKQTDITEKKQRQPESEPAITTNDVEPAPAAPEKPQQKEITTEIIPAAPRAPRGENGREKEPAPTKRKPKSDPFAGMITTNNIEQIQRQRETESAKAAPATTGGLE